MATTTNYGWTTPDDTALVKDGASAIRSLGSSIDTTLKAQIDAQIPDSLLTTKGDIIAATAASTPSRLASSAVNGDVLQVDTSTATGLKWAAPASGGMTLISTTTLSGATTTLSSIPQTYNTLYLVMSGVTGNTSNQDIRMIPNNDASNSYLTGVLDASATGIAGVANLTIFTETLRTNANNVFIITIDNYTSTTRRKGLAYYGIWLNSASQIKYANMAGGFNSNSAITSIVFDYGGTNTFAGGTVLLYGVK